MMNWRNIRILLNGFVIFLLLTGCKSDMKEVQHLMYPTAIGVDFEDGEYHIFLQLIGLTSVARTEGQESPPQTFVSEATGSTFIDAFFEVYETGQERFLWAHITSVVISEAALKEGIENIFDGLTRYYEFRLTPWIFATKEPLDEVLNTLGFFNQSALETLLHNPQRIHEQSSMIRPIKLHEFAREFYEPARTTYLPSLSVDKDVWAEDQKDEPKLALEGAFFLQNELYKGYYSMDEIKGIRWIERETLRAPILVPSMENPDVLVVFEDINPSIRLQEQDDENITYTVEINLEGYIGNRMNGIQILKKIEDETSKAVVDQIQELYQLGVENNTDFLNLEHILYRERPSEWKKIKNKNETILTKDAAKNIQANVNIKHSGAFKNRVVNVKSD